MMCDENEQRQIQFYMAVTDTFNDTLKLRLANHDQWHNNTLTEASTDDVNVTPNNTSVGELRLIRNNIFSLRCNYSEQTSPLRNLMDVIRQLKPGDKVSLHMRFEAYPRMKWKRSADYAWHIWNNDKVPQRNKIKPANAVQSASKLVTGTVNQIVDMTEDVVNGIEQSVFSTRKSDQITIGRLEIKDLERQRLLVDGELGSDTMNKQNRPVFKSSLYVLIHSEDRVRRDMLIQSVGASFVELNGKNQLVIEPRRIGIVDMCNHLQYNVIDRDPVLLSNEEIGKLVQLPTSDLQQEYKDVLEANRTVEVEVPSVFTDDKGIYMGDVVYRGESKPVFLPTKDDDMLFTPRAFVASPRAGKDMAIVNFIVEAKKKHNIGTVILDAIDERGERGMSDSVRDALNQDDVIDLNLGDYEYPIYLGLQDIASFKSARIIRNRIAQELTSFLMGDGDEHRTEDYLQGFAQAANADPVMIRSLLTNAQLREKVLHELNDEEAIDALQQFNELSSDSMRATVAAPIITRLNKIQRDAFLKPLFGQRYNPKITWGKWMNENKVIIVRIPSRDLGPMAVKTIMHWLTLVIFLTKISGCGGRTYCIFNEPHQYETPGLVSFLQRMLYEGPKYRIAPIFAFYDFKKLTKDFTDVLMSSGVNWHLGNNSSLDVFTRLKDVLTPTFTPEEAKEQVKRFQFIAVWRDTSGEYQTPFLYHAPPLVYKRYETRYNSALTREHSKRYGRPINDVLRDIRLRSKI
ncbi:hypothetical protein [Alicyclobacillus acidoterrestris]|uniref:Uncharacterized protein n=1 Tax=Alicyclobacillus acidoterrestris (strain ATCC 49025 / DSM 3922 / CIP 106132 / NCIMB 13137 / GD3B) TaxID=1356854 RepID=T0C3T6_ALIAG|nr:hypothetical protein [Alicyclobacillus acidoterrestris]EPZ47659.1 hypothetical protein N007_05220 [Alicyclobacillus acidoterrestris ATCC 49025]UNO48023.1 hypothetical protein K1I37_15220 [Alicyclobacillus acidoterrestris]